MKTIFLSSSVCCVSSLLWQKMLPMVNGNADDGGELSGYYDYYYYCCYFRVNPIFACVRHSHVFRETVFQFKKLIRT